MTRRLLPVLLALLASPVTAQSPDSVPKPPVIRKANATTIQAYVALLRLRYDLFGRWKATGKWPDDPAANTALKDHGAYWQKQLQEGRALMAGGMKGDYWDNVALIVFELLHREGPDAVDDVRSIPYSKAALIGVFQSLSIVPGVSRAGATIVGGLILGLARTTIVEFSFLLAVPTMLAATGYDLYKNAASFNVQEFGVLATGFIASFVVALFAIKFLLAFVRTRTFIPFGIYRIIVAIAFAFIK